MELVKDYSWSITIGLIFITLIIIIYGAYYIANRGRKNVIESNEYDKKYSAIQRIIRRYQVCEVNYYWIEKLFVNLGQCKYKNPEKTEILYNEFRDRYKSVTEKLISE